MLALLAVLASTALVQADRDSRAAPTSEARRMVHDFGECIVRKQQRRASEAMLADIGNGELMRRYPQLIDGKCVKLPAGQTVRMSFKGQQFRYALSDALVRRELTGPVAGSFEAVPLLSHFAPAPPSRMRPNGKPLKDARYQELLREYEEDQAFAFLSRLGECVVRLEPAGARALLQTVPASADEHGRFQPLTRAFGTCLPEGRTLSFGKQALRGTIATNYYRLAKAAAGVAK